MSWFRFVVVVLLMATVLCGAVAEASAAEPVVLGADIRSQAASVLSLMAYTVTPDVTTSALRVTNADTDNPGIAMTQFGGGFTLSREWPVYVEGNAAYVRFDPRFLVSDGTEERRVPTRWNSLTLTSGVGWDFPITSELVFRPIALFTLGRVVSDLQVAKWYVERKADSEINFLDGGTLKAIGTGGSVMLDFERIQPDQHIDLEVRYTNVRLRTRSNASSAMQTDATAQSVNVWARYRTPTPVMVFDRPLQRVLELTHSNFFGRQTGGLGFDHLTSLGVGLEADFSAHQWFFSRGRAVLRYLRGDHVNGWSLGLAVDL